MITHKKLEGATWTLLDGWKLMRKIWVIEYLYTNKFFKETPESDINHFFGKFNFETHVIKHFTDSVNRCIHNRIERDRPENEIIIAKNKNLRKKRELCRELGKKNKKSWIPHFQTVGPRGWPAKFELTHLPIADMWRNPVCTLPH